MTRRTRLTVAAVLVVLALLWLPLNGDVEGPRILELTPDHSIMTADLLSVALVLVAAAIAWPARRAAPRARSRPRGRRSPIRGR